MTTPLEHYQQKIDDGVIEKNDEQQAVVQILETIYNDLLIRQEQRDSQVGKLRRKVKPRPPIQGLYLWGTVGVGKTFLLDALYDCLPVKKIRLHFYAFMRQIHQALKEIQGQKNPLQHIGEKISDKFLVICFDEFFVSNIADAMILGELFKALFKGGVCLVATSNITPDELYKNGLQRERFLPAIDVIKKNVRVINLKTKADYRLRHIQKAGVYYTPLDQTAEKNLAYSFDQLAQCPNVSTEAIEILGRRIDIVKQAADTIWFDFYKICGRPRSQNDYLELVKQYRTFLISNVPAFNKVSDDLIVSFIQLIDVLYDKQRRIVISAEKPVDQLYPENNVFPEFKRTQSRLIEMQSADYFNR